MKFEDILEEINGFGPFQILIIILLCIPRIVLPCHFLLNNFIAAFPPHHCDISTLGDGGLLKNLTHEQRLTVSIPVREDGVPKSCEMFAEPQFQLLANGSISADLPTVQCQSGWVYDNSTFTSTLATEWDLVCDRKSLTKTTGTIFFVGVMMGGIAFGFLSDKYVYIKCISNIFNSSNGNEKQNKRVDTIHLVSFLLIIKILCQFLFYSVNAMRFHTDVSFTM